MENNLKLLSKLKRENLLTHIELDCCPMCSSKNSKDWCEVDENSFKTVECNDCGLWIDLDLVLQKMKSPKDDIKCPPFINNMMTVVLQF